MGDLAGHERVPTEHEINESLNAAAFSARYAADHIVVDSPALEN
jgi:hypothetical protein